MALPKWAYIGFAFTEAGAEMCLHKKKHTSAKHTAEVSF